MFFYYVHNRKCQKLTVSEISLGVIDILGQIMLGVEAGAVLCVVGYLAAPGCQQQPLLSCDLPKGLQLLRNQLPFS